jgi:pimeloyl-ACP methyl ester carboxylesterase
MDRVSLGDVEIAYEVRGQGDPVVFVHHGAGVDWFLPLMRDPAVADRVRAVRYHRAGYGESSRPRTPITFADEAIRFRALMDRLGIAHAHVVGHSASACIALQIAMDDAERVRSIALLEPALMAVPSPPEVPRAMELFRAGDTLAAVDTFLRGTCGAEYRPSLTAALPNAVEQASANADVFFTQELPALRQWSFGADEARRVRQPILAVLGELSDVRFHQRQRLLLEWLPQAEPFVLAGAGHLLHLQNTKGMAEALAAFWSRHAIT